MKYIDDLESTWRVTPRPVVTLGNFDGIHLGHQKIFDQLKNAARELESSAVVVTFFPHPLRILAPEKAPRLIISLDERLRLMEAQGIDWVICIRFTEDFARWSAERFVKQIIVEKLRARALFVGMDFRFGRDRRGDVPLLSGMGKQLGFNVHVIQPVRIENHEVSSTRIRQLIREGSVRESSRLLGRCHRIHGMVAQGDKRGRALGFPTANLETTAELIPPSGVYAVRVGVGSEFHPGVASLGTNPTFSGKHFSIEAYILDFDEDIYGKPMSIDFIDRIRGEEKFVSPDALVAQIKDDVRKAREILSTTT